MKHPAAGNVANVNSAPSANDTGAKEKGAANRAAPRRFLGDFRVLPVIVVVVVPVAIGVPAMVVFVPPAVPVTPAILARCSQFRAPASRLRAVPAMMLRRFVQAMVRAGNAALANVVVGTHSRRTQGENNEPPKQRGGSGS